MSSPEEGYKSTDTLLSKNQQGLQVPGHPIISHLHRSQFQKAAWRAAHLCCQTHGLWIVSASSKCWQPAPVSYVPAGAVGECTFPISGCGPSWRRRPGFCLESVSLGSETDTSFTRGHHILQLFAMCDVTATPRFKDRLHDALMGLVKWISNISSLVECQSKGWAYTKVQVLCLALFNSRHIKGPFFTITEWCLLTILIRQDQSYKVCSY